MTRIDGSSRSPQAAAQIEDVHIGGCSSFGNVGLDREQWTNAFPNLKTIWAYHGAAPSPGSDHLRAWSAATQGRQDDLRPGALMKQNVATWSVSGGYQDRVVSIASLREEQRGAEARYDAFWTGKTASSTQSIADYRMYRSISKHPNATPEERADATNKASALLRVNHFGAVAKSFAAANADLLKQGYSAMGREVPNLGSASRAEALAEVARLDAEVDAMKAPPSIVTALRQRLELYAALDPNVLPDNWCN
jgi:hypothetical protein